MSHTSLLFHCVFATKGRRPLIKDEIQTRLWAYMGGVAKTNAFKAIAVGGTRDHVHLLLSLPPTMPIAKAMQLIKAGSSKWMQESLGQSRFEWQEKYGAFTVGISQKATTVRYIQNQKKHHAKMDSAQEWKKILERHGLNAEE